MKHVILSRFGILISVPLSKSNKLLEIEGVQIIASCDSKEKAESMIMGIQVDKLIEKYATNLSTSKKIQFKIEMAQIATNMYNQIIQQ